MKSAEGLVLTVLLVGRALADAPYHLPHAESAVKVVETGAIGGNQAVVQPSAVTPSSTPTVASIIIASPPPPLHATLSTPAPVATMFNQDVKPEPTLGYTLPSAVPVFNNGLNLDPFTYPQLRSPLPIVNQAFNQDPFYPQRYSNYYQEPTDVYKHVYVHVAPEEPAELQQPIIIAAPKPKKHYKIVFIKAPTPLPPVAAYVNLPQPDQEKTLIYVLSKKPDLKQHLVVKAPSPTPPSKPEVFFIRYKPNVLPDLGQQHPLPHSGLAASKPLLNSYGVPLGEPLSSLHTDNKAHIVHNTVQ